MNNIACFIVTKDRPFQLWGCLESIRLNCPDLLDFYILEKSSNDRMAAQYEQVYREARSDNFNFTLVKEKDFQEDFLSLLHTIGEDGFEHVMCFTDDTFFFRPLNFPLADCLKIFAENDYLLSLQLRLGLNTIYQDPRDFSKELKVPQNYYNVEALQYLKWLWNIESPDTNIGYPISLDGNIYRTDTLYGLSTIIEFHNLREWEGNLIGYVRSKEYLENDNGIELACLEYSHTVNISYNLTQYPYKEKDGPCGISLTELANAFDEGYRPDIKVMFLDRDVQGSHVFLPMKYRKV